MSTARRLTMDVQVGKVTLEGPDGPVEFRVIQASDPVTGLPVCQISIPIGEQSVAIGRAVAGDDPEPKLVIPDAPPPPSDLRG
jgi:hypothetical protein